MYDILTDGFGHDALRRIITEKNPSTIAIVTDSNVEPIARQKIDNLPELRHAPVCVLDPGEEHKTLESVERVERMLCDSGATRRSLVINIGGGMITDLGGFAAAIFKRGIDFINMPTSLLGAVDAAIGGKTAVNFMGLKNEIGAFRKPLRTIIRTADFASLPRGEMLSGYAEMIKTGYISGHELLDELMQARTLLADTALLAAPLRRCLDFKEEITRIDPEEHGIRAILNFGHTAGHAFESLMLERNAPVAHGVAVAHGILVALILSHFKLGLPSAEASRYASRLLNPLYAPLRINCTDYPRILALMGHDKKNATAGHSTFVLLKAIGKPELLPDVPQDDIKAALDIYRDLTMQ